MDLVNLGGLLEAVRHTLTPEALAITSAKAATAAPTSIALGQAVKRYLERRTIAAQKILLEEIAEGATGVLTNEQTDDLISMIYRYHRAMNEGSARLNMRLLARVIAGQIEQRALTSNEFLYYADILASLRREEIILAATLHKHRLAIEAEPEDETAKKEYGPKRAFDAAKAELVPRVFPVYEDMFLASMAMQRTGLISSWDVPHLGGSATYFRSTKLLEEVRRFADFDDVLRREDDFDGSDTETSEASEENT